MEIDMCCDARSEGQVIDRFEKQRSIRPFAIKAQRGQAPLRPRLSCMEMISVEKFWKYQKKFGRKGVWHLCALKNRNFI